MKVAITANARAPGRQFMLRGGFAGQSYDGHTLRQAIEGTERLGRNH